MAIAQGRHLQMQMQMEETRLLTQLVCNIVNIFIFGKNISELILPQYTDHYTIAQLALLSGKYGTAIQVTLCKPI